MTHQNQHQETAQKLITAYQGPEPLAAYLKKYFAANKKHGSKDRKSISAFCSTRIIVIIFYVIYYNSIFFIF